MKQLAYLLLSATLLAAPACSKDDPEPADTNTARYTLDGRAVSAEATYSVQTGGAAVGADDMLYIRVADPARRPEVLVVIFSKAPGAPESAYRASNLEVTDNTGASSYYSENLNLTVTKTSSGYSGTFAGSRRLPASTGGTGTSQVSGGTFTNVR